MTTSSRNTGIISVLRTVLAFAIVVLICGVAFLGFVAPRSHTAVPPAFPGRQIGFIVMGAILSAALLPAKIRTRLLFGMATAILTSTVTVGSHYASVMHSRDARNQHVSNVIRLPSLFDAAVLPSDIDITVARASLDLLISLIEENQLDRREAERMVNDVRRSSYATLRILNDRWAEIQGNQKLRAECAELIDSVANANGLLQSHGIEEIAHAWRTKDKPGFGERVQNLEVTD